MTSDVLPDGRTVVQRVKAKLQVPFQDHPVENSTVDELLLDDGNVVFQCAHPDPIPGATEPCSYLSDNGVSVRAHQKSHGRTAHARFFQEQATKALIEAEKTAAELKARKQRQVEGGKKAAETRKTRQNGSHSTNVEQAKQLSRDLQSDINLLAVEVNRVARDLTVISDGLRELQSKLKNTPLVDAETLEKAQRFDVIQASLSGLKS